MKIEEAIIYVLSTFDRGLSTEQIAYAINMYELHKRRDGAPVTSAQVYAATRRHPQIFAKEGRLIHLIM